ncbi:MAG: hypothetical protein OXL96_28565 [Candidatus Poribacteria bacterium]|nr:hypothetical protein [Candidatus Poribacteria bacterium]
MKTLAGFSASIVFFVAFYWGAALYSMSNAVLALQGTFVAVLILVGGPLCFYLGIELWKRKRDAMGFVTLIATSGIAGAAMGLSLMFWVLD